MNQAKKMAMASPFKSKGLKKLQEDFRKQEEDAKFLNDLLNQKDNAPDADVAQREYEKMKDELEGAPEKKEEVLQGLKLPQHDPSEVAKP